MLNFIDNPNNQFSQHSLFYGNKDEQREQIHFLIMTNLILFYLMNIKETLDKYFEEKGRIGVKLSVLLYSLRSQDEPIRLLQNLWKPGQDILKLFKIIILVHECFYQEVLPIQETISFLGSLINKATLGFKNKPNKFEEHLFSQGIQPYALYLQKKLQNQNQPELDKEDQLFRDLNLLKRGVSFAEILCTFGRYFCKSHEFFIDFNIILAREVNLLYHTFQTRIARCKYMYDSDLRIQVEKVHQKMYIIFYNAYYHREVRDYVPRWLNTEENKRHDERYCRSARKPLKKKLSLPNKFNYNIESGAPISSLNLKKNISSNSSSQKKLQIKPQINSVATVTTQRQTSCYTSRPGKGQSLAKKKQFFLIYYDDEDLWNSSGKTSKQNPEKSFENDFSVTLQRERIDLMSSLKEVVSMISDQE